jgi:hypothetical protein
MHEMGICGEAPVRRPRTTDSGHAFPRYPNLSSSKIGDYFRSLT